MIHDGQFTEPWDEDEPRTSKFVLIGRNLDHAELKKRFDACIAPDDFVERKKASLRFAIGTEVECRMEEDDTVTWLPGVIVRQVYHDDESMPPGMVAPYGIQVDDGEIWCPVDSDDLIRLQSKKRKARASGPPEKKRSRRALSAGYFFGSEAAPASASKESESS